MALLRFLLVTLVCFLALGLGIPERPTPCYCQHQQWRRAQKIGFQIQLFGWSTMLSILIEEFLPESYNRRFSLFRRYNAAVPQFLHDRPPTLIDHCMERLSLASEIEKQSIKVLDEERGSFKVGTTCRLVTIKQCHIASVLTGRRIDFHGVSVSYSGSSARPIEEQDTESEVAIIEHVDVSVISNLGTSEIPQQQRFSRGLDTRCEEGVQQVTSLLDVVDDTESLTEAYKLICCCIEILNKAAHKEGLVMEKVPPKSATCTPKSITCTSKSITCISKSNKSTINSSSSCGIIPKAKRKRTFSG